MSNRAQHFHLACVYMTLVPSVSFGLDPVWQGLDLNVLYSHGYVTTLEPYSSKLDYFQKLTHSGEPI